MKKALFILISLLITTHFTGCQSNSAKGDPNSTTADSNALRVALIPTVDCLPFYYAQEQGIYDSLQLNLQIFTYKAQMDCDTAFCNRFVDITYTDLIRASLLHSKDTALCIFMQTDGNHELITAKSKRIKSIEQLKEKMVGIARHSITDYLSDYILSRSALDTIDLYRPQINDLDIRTAMLENATLDAAFLPDPYATQARLKQNRSILQSNKENIHMMALMTRPEYANQKEKKEQVQKLIEGYRVACLKINSSEAAKARQIYRNFDIRQEVIDSLKLPRYSNPRLPSSEDVKRAIEWLYSKGLIPENYQGQNLVNSNFIQSK